MKNKFLTLDDLYNFYSSTSKRSRHFSAKDENSTIVVQVDGCINFEDEDNSTEGLTPVRLQACHINENANRSSISQEVMEKALPSFSNRPILGYIHSVDGVDQFYDHRMHIEDDELVYDEFPVGVITESCNAHLEYDEEKNNTYVVVDGYLFDEYSSASEILKREQECKVSVELNIRELSFDAKSKIMNIEDFYFSGVTILGYDPDGNEIKEGMKGSNIKLSDFQTVSDSMFSQQDMISILQEMNRKIDALSNFDINKNSRKEDAKVVLEENVEVTETEEVSQEESTEEVTVTEELSEETVESTPSEEEEQAEEEKFTKTFELSYEDIRCGLYALLTPFEDSDNEYYFITAVYEDHFIYAGAINPNNVYDQKYTKDGDNISFEGDRIHMNLMYVTDNEKVEIESMRSKYDEITDKLAKYEAEPDKMEILNSEEYANIAETEEFIALKAQDAHFDMSVDEVRAKADEMLLSYAKHEKIEFSAKEESKKEITEKRLPITAKTGKAGRYGGIFTKK